MSSTQPDAADAKARPIHSCLRCAARKVKCNKQFPCSACVRHNAQCDYKQYIAPPKRHARAKYDRLNEQLRRYESLLQEHGLNPSSDVSVSNDITQTHAASSVASPGTDPDLSLPTPASTTSGPSLSGSKTQVLQIDGQTRFVDNDLWTRVVEEFDHHEKASDVSSDDDSRHKHDQGTPDLILGSTTPLQSDVLSMPSQQLHALWDIFVENVDPLTKIVHVPTVQKALVRASYDVRYVTRPLMALIFAASSTAVLSLSDDDCARRFGIEQELLISQYMSATKVALSRADLIGTTSLIVLQAFALHILALREFAEPPAVWRLTGLAIRIAESMGLHRDGAEIGLPPFETEIRRRIWWNLKVHDFRSAELAGLVKWQHADRVAYIPKVPTNVNDSEIYPGMRDQPTPSEDPTDAIFCVLRSQLATLRLSKISQQQNGWVAIRSNEELKRQEADVEKAKSDIEMKFLRGLDPSTPLHLVTSLLARTSFNIGTFMMHHPARWSSKDQIPDSEKELLWRVSVGVLVQYDMMTSTPQLRRFAWYTKYHAPWHAVIHILDVLTGVPLHVEAQKVWQLIKSLFENMPELITNTSRLLYLAVGNLCLKAYEAREFALIQGGRSGGSHPRYILELQRLRQARRAKTSTRESEIQRRTRSLNLGTDDVTNIKLSKRARRGGRQDSQDAVLPKSTAISLPFHRNTDTDMSDTGLVSELEMDSMLHSGDTIMNQLDLPQDFDAKFDESLDQDFNWSQWDSWLGSAQATSSEFDLMLADLPS